MKLRGADDGNDDNDNDYVNASDVRLSVKAEGFEEGGDRPLRYVACQGPLAATLGHFWRMVWETGASVVAMVTQEVESGKAKCHAYWPRSEDEPLELCEGWVTIG